MTLTLSPDEITLNAIVAGTLDDDDSIAELRARQAIFLADSSRPTEQYEQGCEILDHALNEEIPRAVAEGTPAVRVLQATMIALGQMVWRAKEMIAKGAEGEMHGGGGGGESGRSAAFAATLPVSSTTPVAPRPDSKPAQKDAQEPLRRSSRTKAVADINTQEGKARLDHAPSWSARDLDAEREMQNSAPESRTSQSKSALLAHAAQWEKKTDELKARLVEEIIRPRKRQKPTLSPQQKAQNPLPKHKKVFPPPKNAIPRSAMGPPPKPSLIVTLPLNFAKLSPHLTTTNDDDDDDDNNNENMGWETSPSPSPTASPPPPNLTNLPTYAFPPYPPLSPRSLIPFTHGVVLAIENIAEAHIEAPELSLLELVTELDETKPIVPDWERRTVLRGAEYVYEAVRQLCAEEEGQMWGEVRGEAVKRVCEEFLAHVELEGDMVQRRLGKGERA